MNREEVIQNLVKYLGLRPDQPVVRQIADWHLAKLKERTEKCAEIVMEMDVSEGSHLHRDGFQFAQQAARRAILALNEDEKRWCSHTEFEHGKWFFRQYGTMCAEPVNDNCNACPICGKERPK